MFSPRFSDTSAPMMPASIKHWLIRRKGEVDRNRVARILTLIPASRRLLDVYGHFWRFKGKSVHALSMQSIAAILNTARPQARLAICDYFLVPIRQAVHADGFGPPMPLGKSSLT